MYVYILNKKTSETFLFVMEFIKINFTIDP